MPGTRGSSKPPAEGARSAAAPPFQAVPCALPSPSTRKFDFDSPLSPAFVLRPPITLFPPKRTHAGSGAAPAGSLRRSERERKPPRSSPSPAAPLRTTVTDTLVQECEEFLAEEAAKKAQDEFEGVLAAARAPAAAARAMAGTGTGDAEEEMQEEEEEEEEEEDAEEEEEEEGGGGGGGGGGADDEGAFVRQRTAAKKLSKVAAKARENDAEYWGGLDPGVYKVESEKVSCCAVLLFSPSSSSASRSVSGGAAARGGQSDSPEKI